MIELALPDRSFTLDTDRGVFSGDRVDPGTRLLLLEISTDDLAPGAVIADVGCGYGPISVVLAARRPDATVWAVDVNDRALELCRGNAKRAGLDNIRVFHADDVPGGSINGIWSNPPIRIGKPALRSLLSEWLDRMTPDATAHLVVQRNLGADSLARWLVDQGYNTERRISRRGYRLVDVRRTGT